LVPTEAELARAEGRDYEPASVLLERILADRRRRWEESELGRMRAKGKVPNDGKWRAKYKEPRAPDTSNLSELQEGWCWATMDQLAWRITSGSRDWTKYYDRGESVFLMAQNVRPGLLDLSYRQRVDPPAEDASCERSQVAMDDLLVTIVGANTGDVCRVPTDLPKHYVCQSVALMRPAYSQTSKYLDAYLNSPVGRHVYQEFMYGQGRPHLSFDNLKETLVPVPPLAEQLRIIASLDRMQSVIATIATAAGVDVRRCRSVRQSVIKWAFEGRLVDQDPADEPASKLLERIKVERDSANGRNTKKRARGDKRAAKG
jgi:type I restriction enzyme S subunit